MVVAIGSLSLLMLLFNDDILRFYREASYLRMQYVKQMAILQKQSLNLDDGICRDIQVPVKQNNYTVSFKTDLFEDGIRHFAECRRVPLFKSSLPSKKHYRVTDLNQFIYTENMSLFDEILNTHGKYQLLFFAEDENTFELTTAIDGIILAEGKLRLTGKGKFRGAIITVGELTYEDNVKISYSKAVVEATAQQFSKWKLSKQSWSDFIHHARQQ